MDVVQKTFFQIKPTHLCGRCVFCGRGFSINDILLVSPVDVVGKLCYRFTVSLDREWLDKIIFDFETKTDAILAYRELLRAYTETGEFADDYKGIQNTVQNDLSDGF